MHPPSRLRWLHLARAGDEDFERRVRPDPQLLQWSAQSVDQHDAQFESGEASEYLSDSAPGIRAHTHGVAGTQVSGNQGELGDEHETQ